MHDLGIDLGTTFSVIAVKGQVKLSEGYPPGRYEPEMDITIIPTPEGDSTFPSILWMDQDDPMNILVGYDAKAKAEDGGEPIMFAKRSIGTDQLLRTGSRNLTAKEVSAHLLRYLKRCAEQALGEPVRRAVVTHPAYFDRNAVQETREAAEEAGFDMSLPEQMMMEPTAAALAYTLSNEQDPLRIMTYDLGGGTFDVTILERKEGVLTIKSFDGDHLLGGYNFDKALVQWILDQLKLKGRTIPHDDDNPEHRSRRIRLLTLAEDAKIRLSEARTPKAPIQIRAPNILVDSEGHPVQILERITREEFAALIEDDLQVTLECCQRALDKAGLTVRDLDSILLVGGSTYGKWVTDVLVGGFGIEPEQFPPDLCVAAGAALRASALPAIATAEGIGLILDVPRQSAIPLINVAGRIEVSGGSAPADSIEEWHVFLTAPSIGTREAQPDAESSFILEDIELRDEGPNEFELEVIDKADLSRLKVRITVEYSPETISDIVSEIHTVLPKPIYIRTVDGMKPLAEEGAVLPAKCEIKRRRVHGDTSLDIEVFQDEELISTIEVANIAPDAGVGSWVSITVEITQANEMKGHVKVTNRSGVLAAEQEVKIRFPPLRIPDLAQLHAEFDVLEAKRLELVALSDDPEHRVLLDKKGGRMSKKLAAKFKEDLADRQEIHAKLKQFSMLINPPKEEMNPPRIQFRQRLDYARELLHQKGNDPEVEPIKPLLQRIESEGEQAYNAKNHKKWTDVNESLGKLLAKLEKIVGCGRGPVILDDAVIQKEERRNEVETERANLQNKHEALSGHPRYVPLIRDRLNELAQILNEIEAAIDRVEDSTEPERALAQLRVATRRLQEVHKRAGQVVADI